MQFLTEKELMETLRISRSTIRLWRQQGCPYRGAERSFRYDPETVMRWREQKDRETPGGAECRVICDAKEEFMEGAGKHIYDQIDELRDRLPAEMQEEFETWATNLIHEAFEGGWRAAK